MEPQNSKISIIMAYRPVRGMGVGLLTVEMQHRKSLCNNVDPRAQMLADLKEYITPLIKEAYDIILEIDANETLPQEYCIKPTGFNIFCIEIGLVNALTARHARHDFCPVPLCRHLLSSPIDFIPCSPKLIPFVIRPTGTIPGALNVSSSSWSSWSRSWSWSLKNIHLYIIYLETLADIVQWQSENKSTTQRAARHVLSYELVLNTNTHTAVV